MAAAQVEVVALPPAAAFGFAGEVEEFAALRAGDAVDDQQRRDIFGAGADVAGFDAAEFAQDEIVTLLNESKLLVMASLTEGLPKAMLEALACGTPVVVTDGCNATEIVKGAGIEVPSADSRALARAVNQLLGDEELWQQYAHNARSRVLGYTWESIAADNYREYQRLLA